MFQVVLGGLMNMILFAMLIAGVAKLFSVHSELGEIKELLKDIKRNGEIEGNLGFARQGSAGQPLQHLQQAVQGYPPQGYQPVVQPIVPSAVEYQPQPPR